MTAPSPPGSDTHLLALAAMRCRAGAPRLTDEELRAHLSMLPGWSYAGNRIGKTFAFADYGQTIAFVNAVAWIAQRQDHHPDLTVGFDRCGVAFSTHDASGVTLNDCICAAKVERLSA